MTKNGYDPKQNVRKIICLRIRCEMVIGAIRPGVWSGLPIPNRAATPFRVSEVEP